MTLNLTVKPSSFSSIDRSVCQGQSYLNYSNIGTYIDTFIAANGCDSIRTLNLAVEKSPDPYLGVDAEICTGDSLVLYPGLFSSYVWQDASTTSHFTVKQPGLYFVTVTNGCGSQKTGISITGRDCNINFPTAFTPNGDGKNDLFKILNAHALQDYSLVIYNRWGEKGF